MRVINSVSVQVQISGKTVYLREVWPHGNENAGRRTRTDVEKSVFHVVFHVFHVVQALQSGLGVMVQFLFDFKY
jgi:hypothetical protein